MNEPLYPRVRAYLEARPGQLLDVHLIATALDAAPAAVRGECGALFDEGVVQRYGANNETTGHRSELWSEDHDTFSPRVECIPSRDPLPWEFYCGQFGCTGHRENFERTGMSAKFKPRFEFARPPVNHYLGAVRLLTTTYPTARAASLMLEALDDDPRTTPEVKHARAVLSRLVALA